MNYHFILVQSKLGFPSPADDHMENKIDISKHLIKHPATFCKAAGESMINAGIHPDILVVDRSLEPKNGKIVIAAVDGQLTVKRLQKSKRGIF